MNCPICGGRLEGTKDDKRLYCKVDDTFIQNPPNERFIIP